MNSPLCYDTQTVTDIGDNHVAEGSAQVKFYASRPLSVHAVSYSHMYSLYRAVQLKRQLRHAGT